MKFISPAFKPLTFVLCIVLSACGGSSGGNDGGGDGNDNPDPVTYDCEGSGTVTIAGRATYADVPAVEDKENTLHASLDYGATFYRPIRKAAVVAICPDGSSTYSESVTDENGKYTLDVPENVDVVVRIRASMQQSRTPGLMPGWNVRVVDNTRSQSTWSVDGAAFDSETGSATVNVRAKSGWDGSAYSGDRAAAPFAILDAAYTAMQKVLSAEPDINFPALKLNWSPKNTSCNNYPFSDGCIGTSFFSNFGGSAARNIFVLGKAGDDTDEYDEHVIIHEWGHYYEDAFSRSDSIGGSHAGGDALDARVAFGEGWGNAWSGIATDDPVYVDTYGSNQASGFWFDVEDNGGDGAHPGWWNEATVQEILYDIYDAEDDDTVSLGFTPMHEAFVTQQKVTPGATTLFSLIHYIQQDSGEDLGGLLAAHSISPITDVWGSGRTAIDDGSEFGAGDEHFVSPVYLQQGVLSNGNKITNVCTSNAVDPLSASESNRLGTRRFISFEVDTTTQWTVEATSDLSGGDPDFYLFRNGELQTVSGASAGDDETAAGAAETATLQLVAGQVYLLELLDWLNVDEKTDSNGNDTTGGEACLEVTFSY